MPRAAGGGRVGMARPSQPFAIPPSQPRRSHPMATRKTQQQPEVTDGYFWRTIFRGVPMRLEYRDLSNQRLRVVGQLFGEDYEVPMEFIRRLLMGNMTAW